MAASESCKECKGEERKACLNKEINELDCPCSNTDCGNHGICCECITSHRAKGNKPACMR